MYKIPDIKRKFLRMDEKSTRSYLITFIKIIIFGVVMVFLFCMSSMKVAYADIEIEEVARPAIVGQTLISRAGDSITVKDRLTVNLTLYDVVHCRGSAGVVSSNERVRESADDNPFQGRSKLTRYYRFAAETMGPDRYKYDGISSRLYKMHTLPLFRGSPSTENHSLANMYVRTGIEHVPICATNVFLQRELIANQAAPVGFRNQLLVGSVLNELYEEFLRQDRRQTSWENCKVTMSSNYSLSNLFELLDSELRFIVA